jgi:hypothetical protein
MNHEDTENAKRRLICIPFVNFVPSSSILQMR